MEKVRIRKDIIKSKSKRELEEIVWGLWVSYFLDDDTDKGQENTFRLKLSNKPKINNTHFTDIDYQKCRVSNGKVYL